MSSNFPLFISRRSVVFCHSGPVALRHPSDYGRALPRTCPARHLRLQLQLHAHSLMGCPRLHSQHKDRVTAETNPSTKPKIFIIWSFTEDVCRPLGWGHPRVSTQVTEAGIANEGPPATPAPQVSGSPPLEMLLWGEHSPGLQLPPTPGWCM